ncbi:nucleoside recognition domain-containing protein [Candidatus Zixiibacteriota bacterium]
MTTGTTIENLRQRPSFRQTLGAGLHKGLGSYWMLCKVMVPVYVIMTVLAQTPVLPWIAGICAPLMKYLGLPGDAAMALILGMTINLYASIAATVALNLTPQQMTIVGVIILVSHNNIMEGAILHKTGAPVGFLIPLRIVASLVLGWLVATGYGMVG